LLLLLLQASSQLSVAGLIQLMLVL